MIPTNKERDRANELLADRATEGIDAEAEAELRSIFGPRWSTDREGVDAYEIAAAAVHLSALRGHVEAMPAHLARAVEEQALAAIGAAPPASRAGSQPPADLREVAREAPRVIAPTVIAPTVIAPTSLAPVVPIRAPSRFARTAPWLAAAAFMLLAVAAWVLRGPSAMERAIGRSPIVFAPSSPSSSPPAPAPAVDLAAARAELLHTAPDAVELAWSSGKAAADANATGDVVWSDREQRGFMRFHGVAPNDPKELQYQLWIFDEGRDDAYPVDGGVFDVASGDVIVPIKSKLGVKRAKLFAVTAEKPGGVVVSKRERIVVSAAIKTG